MRRPIVLTLRNKMDKNKAILNTTNHREAYGF